MGPGSFTSSATAIKATGKKGGSVVGIRGGGGGGVWWGGERGGGGGGAVVWGVGGSGGGCVVRGSRQSTEIVGASN